MTAPATPLLPNLPLHMMLTLGCWLSSPFALQCVKSASPPLKAPEKPKNPRQSAQSLPNEAPLKEALAAEAKKRAASLLTGLLRYADTGYTRSVTEPACIWRKGNARLLDYGASAGSAEGRRVVLFVPSLINRYYILDLEEDRSMLRFLASQGMYPLVLDWGQPGDTEADYDCASYIQSILLPAIDFIAGASHAGVILAGYCMGGVLSVAAARLRPQKVSALALLATPWNFHCPEFSPFVVDDPWKATISALIEQYRQLPADIVQSLFYLTDPWVFEQKFRRFAELAPESRAARDFVALEHWVNDGVPMTAGVARDCLLGWAQNNKLAENEWVVAKKRIDPHKIDMPTFIAIPRNDHVVPHSCAISLAQAMPHATMIHPSAGHVGMIVGSHARRELWQPFAQWAAALA